MKHNPSSSSPPRVVRPWRREQGTWDREGEGRGGGHLGTKWVPTDNIIIMWGHHKWRTAKVCSGGQLLLRPDMEGGHLQTYTMVCCCSIL